ncbi:transporter [Adhaeribacter rhizoryzae]|uniref:Uncharacterized protein n=1 Tax=Adhaeribacter rhizoryzae TaxID=2607907 RepID=A0A5M6DPQ4_9BACT|nr:transporter [Adhaeribacter rhizoryzae]KAA5548189.1 hypothetical protein F0145_05525 [Adhaeribacter rhizoryzae]
MLATSNIGFSQGMVDGFMKGKGNSSVALSYSYESYDTYFVGGTTTQNPNLGTIATRSLSIYGVAGLTDKLDAIVSLPYIKATANQGFWQDQKGLQDAAFYLKYNALEQKLGNLGSLSVMVAGGIATPFSNYIADAPVAIGHHSTNLDGRLITQLKSNYGFFLSAQGGYIYRSDVKLDRDAVPLPESGNSPYYNRHTSHVPNSFDYSAKLGFASSLVYADAWLHKQEASKGTNIGPGIPFPSNAVSYTRTGFNLFVPLPFYPAVGLGGGSSFTLNGKNVGKATRFSGSLVYNLPSWQKKQI